MIEGVGVFMRWTKGWRRGVSSCGLWGGYWGFYDVEGMEMGDPCEQKVPYTH